MKYLLIKLYVLINGRETIIQTLSVTKDNPQDHAQEVAKNFWYDEAESDGIWWEVEGGMINTKVSKVTELTKEEYNRLHELFY